jgi:hypothetical protein
VSPYPRSREPAVSRILDAPHPERDVGPLAGGFPGDGAGRARRPSPPCAASLSVIIVTAAMPTRSSLSFPLAVDGTNGRPVRGAGRQQRHFGQNGRT